MNSPRQAISTRYFPATNSKGSRIKATCDRGSITIDYPHEMSGWECHEMAFKCLLEKFAKQDGNDKSWGHPCNYVCGGMHRGSKEAYVFVSTR